MTGSDAADITDLASATGSIRTFAQGVIEGNSHFYVTLDGDKRIYDFALPGLVEIAAYGVGDTISFTYIDSDPTCPVQSIESAGGSKTSSADSAAGGAGESATDPAGASSAASAGSTEKAVA